MHAELTRCMYAGAANCRSGRCIVKVLPWIVASALLLGLPAAQAQQVLAHASSAPPPPGIDDPGAQPQAVPLPSTGIPPSVAPAGRNGGRDSTNVTTRTDANGDT